MFVHKYVSKYVLIKQQEKIENNNNNLNKYICVCIYV